MIAKFCTSIGLSFDME